MYKGGSTEIRDGLDAAWWKILAACLPKKACIPLPNAILMTQKLLDRLPFTGFILTGGDDWGVFPERDENEAFIFDYATRRELPVLGVCRGAQLISTLCGGRLLDIGGHTATRHKIFSDTGKSRMVNSFHAHGICQPGNGMNVTFTDAEGNIEAFASGDGLIRGIMWHPERELDPDSQDMELFAQMFGTERV